MKHAEEAQNRQDFSAMAGWLQSAVNMGNYGAALSLGSLYQEGRGVPRDYNQAIRWYRIAADAKITAAYYFLGYLYANELRDMASARYWMERSVREDLKSYGQLAGKWILEHQQ